MANVDIWVSNQVTLRFGWWQDSQSIANNNSVVGWHLQLVTTGGSISSSASKSWNVTVNGSNYSGTCTIGVGTNSTKTLASGSTTIAHNADGTKSFSFSFSLQFDINYSGVGWIGTKSGSGSGTLSIIPRTSSVSSTNANIGENITITINRASSGFTHTLKYAFCALEETIASGVGASYTWTIPTKFYAQIPNDKSSWGRVICDTYSGSTKIGSSECRFDVYVNESTNRPSISASVVDTNETTKALTGDNNKLVKYYSTATFNATGSAKNSATVKSINVTYNGKTATKSNVNSWNDKYSNCLSGTYTFGVVDSRGYSNSVTVTKTLINYVKITCSMDISNPTAAGDCTLTIRGNYFNGSFGATNNSLTVQYKFNGGDWINATASLNGNAYNATVNLTGLDYTQSYTFQARAIDKLATVTADSKTVKSTPIFDWGSDNFHFHVPVDLKNGSRLYCRHESTDKYLMMGAGGSDVFIHNSASGKYLQLRDSGVLDYDSQEVFHNGNCTTSADSICRTWRYPNGMQISVVKVYGTWDITTAWGSVYSSEWISGQSFNIAFSEAPKVTINAYNATSSIMVCQCSGPTTTATGACYLWKPVQQTGIKTWIEYIAIGRWK